MGVVAEMADRVIVMYCGRKVEEGPVERVFERPRHPYTRGLLAALPQVGAGRGGRARGKLTEIPGLVPSLTNLPPGCRFEPRCPYAAPHCAERYPEVEEKAPGHFAACWESHRLEAVDG
jgi:oligopeptide/dipeptide ABC transporter ATP-binding protein